MNKCSDFRNVLSFDVEEWFHIRRTEDHLPLERWDKLPWRLPICLERILDLLAQTGNRATFFWLGWCAERHRDWVRRLADAGHEIACHGYGHRALDRLTRDEFRSEIRRTRALLQELSGQAVGGFRAPSLSLGLETAWMLDILAEEGFAYDSSLMITPLRANRPQLRRGPHTQHSAPSTQPSSLIAHRSLLSRSRDSRPWKWQTAAGSIVELPLSVRPFGPITLPFAGGLFFRVAPYWAVKATVRQFNARGIAAVFYGHPWEFDPDGPVPSHPPIERFSHRHRLAGGRRKYIRLMHDFRFVPAVEVLAPLLDTRSSGVNSLA
jgi:polysaccharide deacetylase family protein (PEP-CTERM system associated)